MRPVYIYGPLNYNPVEEWFFQRLAEGRPIPIPNSGQQAGAARHPIPTHAAECALRMTLHSKDGLSGALLHGCWM